jgi:hypothetical protein
MYVAILKVFDNLLPKSKRVDKGESLSLTTNLAYSNLVVLEKFKRDYYRNVLSLPIIGS